MISRDVKEAAGINKIVTIAKIIPLLLFLVVVGFAMKGDVFRANWRASAAGTGEPGVSVLSQVRSTMLVTVSSFSA